jgi:hypothetical protein
MIIKDYHIMVRICGFPLIEIGIISEGLHQKWAQKSKVKNTGPVQVTYQT